MKSLRFLAVAPFILIGCGDDENNNGSDATTSTSNPDTNTNCEEPAPGTSGLTGVNTAVTPQPTDPNPGNDGCTSPVISNTGLKYPWGGATVAGRTYTCNACRFGYPFAQGAYRLHGFSKEDGSPCGSLSDTDCAENYSEPKPAEGDFAETLWLDGNTFRVRQKNGSAAGDIEIKGYYFCGMKPEGPNEHVVWAIPGHPGQRRRPPAGRLPRVGQAARQRREHGDVLVRAAQLGQHRRQQHGDLLPVRRDRLVRQRLLGSVRRRALPVSASSR